MNLLDILVKDAIIIQLQATEKREVIAELVTALDGSDKVTDVNQVLEAVLDREKIMSTGIGNGVAIPHGKSDAVTELVAALGITKKGLDFESLDGEPSFIFFLLVSPPDVSGPHIKALAHISRLLKDEEFRRVLIEVTTKEEALALIAKEETKYSTSD
jgi:PTS system nitrogen regulatory IIA component